MKFYLKQCTFLGFDIAIAHIDIHPVQGNWCIRTYLSHIHIQLITNMALERHMTYFREETWNSKYVGQLSDPKFLKIKILYYSLGQTKLNIYATLK